MTLKKLRDLPPFFDSYPIDMHIRIYPRGTFFKAEIRVSGTKPLIFDIGLTQHDVEELNRGLQQAIELVSRECGEDGVDDIALLHLATAGQAAFNRVFADGRPKQTILMALEMMRMKTNPTIEISTENFFIPWEILHYGPFDSKGSTSCFWGMWCILSRTIVLQEDSLGSLVSPVIQSSCPSVGLITCDELGHVTKQEIPALRTLHRNKKIRLLLLRPLDFEQQSKELEYFGRFLRKKLHIAHFACHAYANDPLDLSFLRISNAFNITMRDLYSREFETEYHPFVILNACRTGVISPLHTSSWATLFWKYGARGVLATEFRVPDSFASAFVEEVYQHFLSGKPIGEALLLSRRTFWEGQHNPLGLAYALYSPLAIRIAEVN